MASDSNQPDMTIIKPFIEGTLQTLKVQCALNATHGKPYIKGSGPDVQSSIAAVLGLTSTAFRGSLSICFPEATFLAIMGRLLGETYTQITTDLEDGAGELLNIIFGFAKKVLNERSHTFEKAIPTVVRGEGLSVRHLTNQATLILPFESELGAFAIEICIEKNTE